jgi:hypothetical protein
MVRHFGGAHARGRTRAQNTTTDSAWGAGVGVSVTISDFAYSLTASAQMSIQHERHRWFPARPDEASRGISIIRAGGFGCRQPTHRHHFHGSIDRPEFHPAPGRVFEAARVRRAKAQIPAPT